MKIIINKNVILLALSRIQSVVEKSSIMPITANALITAKENILTVSATNLEIGMIAHYNEVTIKKEGTLSVNARKFFEIIRELPEEEITIDEKENYHMVKRIVDIDKKFTRKQSTSAKFINLSKNLRTFS